MNFKKWVKRVQTAGQNGAHTVVVWLEKLGLKIFGVEMFSNPVVTTIIHRIVFLHPTNDNGDTPFHLAANNGHTQGNQLQGIVVWSAVTKSVMKSCYPAENNNF